MRRLVISLLLFTALTAAAPARAATPAQLLPLEQKFGLRVIALGEPVVDRDRAGTITCEPPSDAALESFMPVLVQELMLYEPEVLQRAGVKRIVLCADLKDDGVHVGGLADGEDDAIFVDVEAQAAAQAFYKAKAIHHELMHMIDRKDGGDIVFDPGWTALNPAGFAYDAGGRSRMGDRLQGMVDPSLVGFLTRYGTAALAEDKAELFSYLVVRPNYVGDRMRDDDVLRRKVERLKAELQAFLPSMDSSFWRNLEMLRGPH